MEKVNDYFGLYTASDRTWFYGVFGIGSTLYAVDMFIAYIL
ncbi:TPA: DUF3961 domain-containing protein [Bacillus pseudomycoides]|nr:DUF3961 domain-containing protein [Bacillus pseudomycoides]